MVRKKKEEVESQEEKEVAHTSVSSEEDKELLVEDIGDWGIGDIGLATAPIEVSWKSQDLESSFDDEPLNKWEERNKESSDEDSYEKTERRKEVYNGDGFHASDRRDADLYVADSEIYSTGADEGGRDFYDPRIERKGSNDGVSIEKIK